jgi:hypothetical protein
MDGSGGPVRDMVGNPVVEAMVKITVVMTMETVTAVEVMPVMKPVANDNEVEIVENEKAREKEPCVPERVRHPGIEIAIVRRRRIVGYDRRTLLVIVVVDLGRRHILGRLRGLALGISLRCRRDRHAKVLRHFSKCLQGFVSPQAQLLRRRSGDQRTLNLTDNDRCHGIIRDPSVPGRNPDRRQHILGFRLCRGFSQVEGGGEAHGKFTLRHELLPDGRSLAAHCIAGRPICLWICAEGDDHERERCEECKELFHVRSLLSKRIKTHLFKYKIRGGPGQSAGPAGRMVRLVCHERKNGGCD